MRDEGLVNVDEPFERLLSRKAWSSAKPTTAKNAKAEDWINPRCRLTFDGQRRSGARKNAN